MENLQSKKRPGDTSHHAIIADPHVSLIIPCFNEFQGLSATTEAVLRYVKDHFSYYTFELILVNDGSTDGTGLLIQDLAEQWPEIRPIFFEDNRGRGAAIKAGLQASKGRYVITLDADLSYDVEHVGAILKCFEASPKNDVVIVSPYMRNGQVKGVPFSRLVVSRVANWVLSGFFSGKLSTVTCVVRGYRGSMIRDLALFEEGKELHLEILRKLAICGAQMEEVPGKLIWKEKKARAKRTTKLKIADSATKHLLYGLLIKPTRIFKYLALALLLVGIYETGTIFYQTAQFYESLSSGFARSLWAALSSAFSRSPHTFFIAGGCLTLGFQSIFFLALLQVLKLQQEESIRHLLALLKTKQLEFR